MKVKSKWSGRGSVLDCASHRDTVRAAKRGDSRAARRAAKRALTVGE